MTDKCPQCSEELNLACYDCGIFVSECNCGSSHRFCYLCQKDFVVQIPGLDWSSFTKDDTEITCHCEPQRMYVCETCNVVRGSKDDNWSVYKKKKSNSSTQYKKCAKHWHQPVDLGGVTIHCSSMNNDRKGGGVESPIPDFGLYADYGWKPTWQAMIIDWPDFKIPKHYGTACEMIAYGYNLASENVVEIGCIGGHGRTGTILACMKVMHDGGTNDHESVVQWVRDNYCSHAVETENQKWFVAYFSNYWFDTELPEELTQEKVQSNSSTSSGWATGTSCTIQNHFAMMRRGHKKCYDQKTDCKWWTQDCDKFQEVDHSDSAWIASEKILDKYPLRYQGIRLPVDKEDTHLKEMHAVMFEKGFRECALLGADCGFWEEDAALFNAGDFSTIDKQEALKWLDEFADMPKVDE